MALPKPITKLENAHFCPNCGRNDDLWDAGEELPTWDMCVQMYYCKACNTEHSFCSEPRQPYQEYMEAEQLKRLRAEHPPTPKAPAKDGDITKALRSLFPPDYIQKLQEAEAKSYSALFGAPLQIPIVADERVSEDVIGVAVNEIKTDEEFKHIFGQPNPLADKSLGPVSVTIKNIEVKSDDPDRMTMQLADSFRAVGAIEGATGADLDELISRTYGMVRFNGETDGAFRNRVFAYLRCCS